MYVKRNIEARSRNHWCRRKVLSRPIRYSECVPAGLVIQHAMRVRRIILFAASPSLPHCLINGRIFRKELLDTKCVCFHFLYNFCLKNFSGSIQCIRYSRRISIKLEFSRHISEKYSNIKLHDNPPTESRVVSCGWADRQTVFRKRLKLYKTPYFCRNKKTFNKEVRLALSGTSLIKLQNN